MFTHDMDRGRNDEVEKISRGHTHTDKYTNLLS